MPCAEAPRPKMIPLSGRRLTPLTAALLAIGIGAAYSNSLSVGFEFDDVYLLTNNPSIRSLRNIPRFFYDPFTLTTVRENADLRPVLQITYALNHAISGLRPWSYHAVNMVLHLVAASLVFRIVRDHLWPGPALVPAAPRPARPRAGGPRPRVPPLPAPPTPAVGKRDVSPVVHHALALVHERVVGAAVLRAAVPLAGRAVDRPRFPLRVQLLSGSRVAGSVRDRGVDRGRPAQRRPPAPGRVWHRVVLHHPGAGVVLRAACRGGQRSSAVHRVVARPVGVAGVADPRGVLPAAGTSAAGFRPGLPGALCGHDSDHASPELAVAGFRAVVDGCRRERPRQRARVDERGPCPDGPWPVGRSAPPLRARPGFEPGIRVRLHEHQRIGGARRASGRGPARGGRSRPAQTRPRSRTLLPRPGSREA